MIENEMTALVLIMAPLVVIFYGFLVLKSWKRGRVRFLENRFFRAVVSILINNQNEEECIKQLNLNFKKLSEKYPNLSSDLKSSVDLLEYFIHYYDTLGEKWFTDRFDLEITNDIRNRVMKITEKIKEQNPFVSLSSRDANLLINLKNSIETRNADLGLTILNQLAEETEVKESNIRIQENRNNTAYFIATIGVILTIVFGLVSFIR
jgi:hypothetical protein